MIDQEILDIVSRMNLLELPPEEDGDEIWAIRLYCWDCKEMKVLDDFYASKQKYDVKNRHGRHNRCKECTREFTRAWQQTPQGKASSRKTHLKSSYGIDHARYEAMLAAQGGQCAICPATEPGGQYNRWHIDHDHDTGEVRGLLCNNCNRGIGYLRHSPAILLSAAKYITKHIVPDMIE